MTLPDAIPAKGVAQMFSRHRFWFLIAPVLVTTLSGCGVWDAWRYRMSCHDQSIEACNDETYLYPEIQPGHSTDPDQFNQNYAPYSEAPSEFAPTERIAPPPVPPSSADQLTERDNRLPQSSESEHRLIKTLKSPRIFAPDGVRSIYDRIRGVEVETEQPQTPPPTGPIAQNHIQESPTRACLYDADADAHEGPVQLGLPEALDTTPQPWKRTPPQEIAHSEPSADIATRLPSVMQATPSSYKHPLLADPTGVPYGRQ